MGKVVIELSSDEEGDEREIKVQIKQRRKFRKGQVRRSDIELKERRHRAAMGKFEAEMTAQRDKEDSEFAYVANSKKHPDQVEEEFEVDRADQLNDGRLALSENEKRAQQMLRRREIEEALSDTGGADSDGMDGSADNALDMPSSEVFDSVAPKHAKSGTTSLKYRLPNLGPALGTFQEAVKTSEAELTKLKQLVTTNETTMSQLHGQLDSLASEEEHLKAQLRAA